MKSPSRTSGKGKSLLEQGSGRTPAGVWVIVGMASLFAATGLALGILIASKTIAEKNDRNAGDFERAVSTGRAKAVEHMTPVIEETTRGQPVAANRVEQDAMRQEVLNRIDLLKSLSQTDKDKLYAQVERAKGFRKIAIIAFAKSGTTPDAGQIATLARKLKEPEMQKLIGDPTVLLFMVGFADQQGLEAKNLEISKSRAESVVKALRERTDIANVMHPVGMGGQNLFDQINLQKNRLVEVWAVQP
jgi:outer membrane protein OmpA-like peptidoglycan-associated protein